MENNELVFITCRNKFFGQTRKPWTSINTTKICKKLKEDGYNVETYDFHEIINTNKRIRNKTIIYSFSQKEYYRQYIKDIVFYLSKHNRIIPSYDLLKCHENKGYQEIYKKEIGLNSLPSPYYTSLEEIDFSRLSYPVVLKTTEGSNGKGVFLIKNPTHFKKIRKKLVERTGFGKRIDLFRRKYFRKKKFAEYPDFSNRQDYYEYKKYIKNEINFIIQDFIPELYYDLRVLVAYDRFYVMRRDVKKGDFKASGSKLFKFTNEPDNQLLNFSKSVFYKFDSPFLSIDILFNGKEYYVAEFQALNFGMSVIAKSKGFFKFDSITDKWIFIEEKPQIESIFAKTILSYLNKI